MSTKASIYFHPETSTHLYEAVTLGESTSHVFIEVENPEENVYTKHYNGQASAMVSIRAEIMDMLAIAWCKHRKLQDALGGPVGKEYGSPDCDYD